MTTRNLKALQLAAFVLTLSAPLPLRSQAKPQSATAALDRSKQPEPGAAPTLIVPTWTKTALPNGAQLIVSPKRNLPLVSVTMNFLGGRAQFENAAKIGVAALTAQMMSEGTTTRTGDQLSEAQQLLGTSISVNIDVERGSIAFTALNSKLDGALALVADMLVNPTFPDAALERRKAQALVALTQQKDQPTAIAANVFARTVFGEQHPYGRLTTEETVKAVSREDIVAFHNAYYQPARAVVTVVGDVDPAAVRASVEKAFASWPAGGAPASFDYPPAPAQRNTTIYLVDKPKAAQSVMYLGHTGPPRSTPDYYALQVMNNILNALFQSRLNHLIREVKGYSYGIRGGSGFTYGRGPGAFRTGADVVTAKSDSALIDFMTELRGIQGGKPFTSDEITQGKDNLTQSMARRFESVDATGLSISSIYYQGLPETYFSEYAAKVNAVTADDLARVAKQYIDLDHLNIVVVGDRATIEEPLRKTGIAPVVILDIQGKPIPVTP